MPKSLESFGARLKRIRESKGLTQDELASRVKTTQAQVSRWEKGQIPGIDEGPQIALGLNVSVLELIGEIESSGPTIEEKRLLAITTILGLDSGDLQLCLDCLKPFIERAAKKSQPRAAKA